VITSLNYIHHLASAMDTQCVTCETETEFLNIIMKKFVLQNIKDTVVPDSNYLASRIPNLGTRWRTVISSTLWSLHLWRNRLNSNMLPNS
jgi:hypothetical protein